VATIYDIAQKTGFSPPTVSKALNGSGSISENTRNLIRRAAREMDYVPNLSARTLKTERSNLIGIINKDLYQEEVYSPPFFSNVLGGFKKVMEANGYDLILLPHSWDETALSPGWGRSIDGILILSVDQAGADYNQLVRSIKPCISANDLLPGISAVITDNYAGAMTAVQHLIDLGHRNIGYVAGPVSRVSTSAEERRQGYTDCLIRNGIPQDPGLTEQAGIWQAQGGYEAAQRLLKRRPDITAIFASSDHLAYGIIKALEEGGRRVPQDISIVGFDGDILGAYLIPALTTMRQNGSLIGRTAGELLLKKLSGRECPDRARIPAELVVRESSRRCTCSPSVTPVKT
jgi:LacI family transcriptional regulator